MNGQLHGLAMVYKNNAPLWPLLSKSAAVKKTSKKICLPSPFFQMLPGANIDTILEDATTAKMAKLDEDELIVSLHVNR